MIEECCWILRQSPSREAIEFCCCLAETKWRRCRILFLEKLWESFVQSQVAYKKIYSESMSAATTLFRTHTFVSKIILNIFK